MQQNTHWSAHDTCTVKEAQNSFKDCASKAGCLEAVNWLSISQFLYDSVRHLADVLRAIVRRVLYVIFS